MRSARGRLHLLAMLARSDLTRRGRESVLLLLALTVASTTLTIGLVLHGQTGQPYARTRSATAGPDVVATAFTEPGATGPTDGTRARGRLAALNGDEVIARAGPFPMTWAPLEAGTVRAVAEVQGRDSRLSDIDRPTVVSGTWVRPGGVVVERSFAVALDVHVGDVVTILARPVPVVGVAVSAALPPYPRLCTVGCVLAEPGWRDAQPGLVWMPVSDVPALATGREPLGYLEFLQLRSPDQAPAFALAKTGDPTTGPLLFSWQEIARRHAQLLQDVRAIVVTGSGLLIALALATVTVIAAGRLTDEARRVGLLKAVGATPTDVAFVLLATYLSLATAASAIGLLVGRLIAPALVAPTEGLLVTTGPTVLRAAEMATVVLTSWVVVGTATLVPVWRASRASTVKALTDLGRPPHRSRLLVRLSAALPAAGLIGLRLAARRPRRTALATASVAVVACGGLVTLYARASLHAEAAGARAPTNPVVTELDNVMLALTLLLAVMSAVNVLFVTATVASDARRSLAIARAAGATPATAGAAVAFSQLVPASVGTTLGGAAGLLLVHAFGGHLVAPRPYVTVVAAVAAVLAVLALAAWPGYTEARRPVAGTLRTGP